MKILVTMPPLKEVELKKGWGAVIAASRGSGMKLDRAYLNSKEGHTVCCWDAPSVADLENLFKKAGTAFQKMFAVEERVAESFAK